MVSDSKYSGSGTVGNNPVVRENDLANRVLPYFDANNGDRVLAVDSDGNGVSYRTAAKHFHFPIQATVPSPPFNLLIQQPTYDLGVLSPTTIKSTPLFYTVNYNATTNTVFTNSGTESLKLVDINGVKTSIVSYDLEIGTTISVVIDAPSGEMIISEIQKNVAYYPTVVIDDYNDKEIAISTTTTITVIGSFLDYIDSISFTAGVTAGALVTLVSSSYDTLTFDITTNATVQQYDVTLTDKSGNDYLLVIQGLNITVIKPNNAPLGVNEALWENKTASAVTAGSTGLQFVQKQSTASSWDTQATFQSTGANTDFELTFNMIALPGTTSYGMAGMNIVNATSSYTDIDHALYLQNQVNVLIYENGASKGNTGVAHLDTNKYMIKRVITGGIPVTTYHINDVQVQVTANPTTANMIFDCSLYRAIRVENLILKIFN